MLKLSPFLLLSTLFVWSAVGVDKNNFKSCDQSSFCRRLRKITPGASPYVLKLETATVEKGVVNASLINNQNGVTFDLKLTGLIDGTFRLVVAECKPLHPRYSVEYALDGKPLTDLLSITHIDLEKGYIKVANTQGHVVILHSQPFKAEFLDRSGVTVMVINGKGLTTMEHMEPKPDSNPPKEEGTADEDIQEEVHKMEEKDPGAWEENYKSHHDSKPRGPEAVSMDVTFPGTTHLYGIPEHADSFALRSTKTEEPYRLYNLDVFEYELQSTMALYGAVPVVYAHGTSHTVGLFWLNSAETWVDVENSRDANVVSSIVSFVSGSQPSEQVMARFMSESGLLDAFIMLGPSPSDTFRQYTRLTGTAPLPQLFSLAYHQSRWNYNDQADVRGVDSGFDEHDIPMDVIWLDIEYTDHKKYFTWDSLKFPNPSEMVANLTAKGRNMVLIIDPHIKREAGYFLHEDATTNGYYVKDKDGKDYEGWCWPGSSSYLDFYDPAVREYYSNRYLLENFPGTSNSVYIWNDMNEPSVFNGPEVTMPKDCKHYGGWEHRHLHNTYGLMQTMATHAGLLERSQHRLRPFVLTRSHFAGSQRYAAVWTGDNEAHWGHLVATIPMCLSLAVAGISHCGADVGGFFKYPEAELMTRWYQAAAFQPFFRAHSHIDTKRREPWLYDAATLGHIKDAIRRRYSYLPLWYTLFYEHSISGLPVMRPLFMHYPKEADLFGTDNQYLIGDSLLVHPVTQEGATSVTVALPGGSQELWYDVDDYSSHTGSRLNVPVTISKIPVFQRGGTIVPKKERMRRSSSLMARDPYTLVVALSNNGTAEGYLYFDDGKSYDYKKNHYIYAKITYKDNILSYVLPNTEATFFSKSWLERVVIAGIRKPPRRAKIQGIDQETKVLELTFHAGNNVLVARRPGARMSIPWEIVFQY